MCLLLCLPFASLSAQASTSATWDDFDKIISNLKAEIDSLSLQVIEAQNNLTASREELNKLKALLVERQALLIKYESLLTLSQQSALTSEIKLQAASRLNVILIITQILSAVGIGYLLFR